MSILDRYIVKKYLSTFFFTMLLITMIAITIDYFERVDKFINSNLSAREIIEGYYIHFVPWINGLLWPLFALLAVIFFTSRMARNSEIISILSAKVSYTRLIRPYMIGAVFVILSKFSTTFSTNLSLPPGLGVWIPNIFFSAVAWFLVRNAQK